MDYTLGSVENMGFSIMHVLFFIIAGVALGWKLFIAGTVFKSVFGNQNGFKGAVGKYIEHQKEDRYYRINRAKEVMEPKK